MREPNFADYVGYTFTIPSPDHTACLGLSFAASEKPVAVGPYDPTSRNFIWRLAYQQWPYAVIGMFDPVHSLYLNLYGGKAVPGAKLYTWPGQYPDQADNDFWKMEYLGEVPGTASPLPISITKDLLKAAGQDKYLHTSLVSDPAAVFVTSGYPLTPEHFK